MTVLNVLFTFFLPALGGLIVGFPSGVITTLYWVGRRRARGETVPIYTDETNPTPGHIPLRGREHLSKLGWSLAIIGIVGVILGIFGLYRNAATQTCLREYINQSSAINQQRATSGEIDRRGIRQQRDVFIEFNQVLIDSITHPVTDPAAVEQRRQDFLVKSNDWNTRLAEVKRLDQEAEAKRQQNPLPPPPDC